MLVKIYQKRERVWYVYNHVSFIIKTIAGEGMFVLMRVDEN